MKDPADVSPEEQAYWEGRAESLLKWTAEPPKKPGWYWIKQPEPCRYWICEYSTVDDFEAAEDEQLWGWQWAGPIPEPEGE